MPVIDLPHGPLLYRVLGPDDAKTPPVVFVHAFLVDGTVWRPVAESLASRGLRAYIPDLPLGAHPVPLRVDADQSLRGVARHLGAFLEALDLRDVTLVASDTGGAITQFLLDHDSSRVGRVLLLNCDAFDTCPPFPFNVVFAALRTERRAAVMIRAMRFRWIRDSWLGFGLLARRFEPGRTRAWIEPALRDPLVLRDAVRFLRALDAAELARVTPRMARFEGEVRVVWGMADRMFTPTLGRRLAAAFRSARFVPVPGARPFVHLDAPDVVVEHVVEMARTSAGPVGA